MSARAQTFLFFFVFLKNLVEEKLVNGKQLIYLFPVVPSRPTCSWKADLAARRKMT